MPGGGKPTTPALAITGGTGFVGRRVIDLAVKSGFAVRALTRLARPDRPGVAWVEGALDDAAALTRLVTGVAAVIHVAGIVNAADRAGFAAGNVDGSRSIVAAASGAGVMRFVHVSSLSARLPELSDYGWSKAGAEAVVAGSALDWTIVRPPAIYGPGDLEMLDLFRAARWGVVLLPPPGRFSVIAVDDVAALLVALATYDPGRLVLEPDDGVEHGWSHAGFATAIGDAVGRRILPLALPRRALAAGARIDRALRGSRAKLTADRIGYLCHADWTIDPARRPAPALWQPAIETRAGLADTAAWYRANRLLG